VTTLSWDGREFPFIDRPSFEEVSIIERQAKRGWSDLGDTLATAALMLITLRRAGIILSWDAMLALSPADFSLSDDDESDPTSPGEETGPAPLTSEPISTG
jgi:hypothetical protein